jgi:hypothetical protein
MFLASLSKLSWLHMYEFTFWLAVLYHWSMCLFYAKESSTLGDLQPNFDELTKAL